MNRLKFLALLLFVTLSLGAGAQTINQITVRSTTGRPISRELIDANMALRPGQPFNAQSLSEDIETLYRTKQFDNIEADVEQAGENLVNINLIFSPKSRVLAIRITGNVNIKTASLAKKIKHDEGGILNEQLLQEDLAALIQVYHEKSYFDVVVNQNIEDVEGGDIIVTYVIVENQRVKTRDIEFTGNTVYTDGELAERMRTDVSLLGYLFPTGWFQPELFEHDLLQIREAYLDKGYLDMQVGEVTKDVRGNKIFLIIPVAEGVPYSVSSITVEVGGVPDGEVQKLNEEQIRELIRQKQGEAYGKGTTTADAKRIREAFNVFGYLDCRVSSDIVPDGDAKTVTVTFKIFQGGVSVVRDINISGNRITKDEVIRRELALQPGDLADAKKIEISENRLSELRYFRSNQIVPVATEIPGMKDLNVVVEESNTGRLILGAGISSADSAFVSAEVAQTNFDLFDWPTFRGAGQRLRLRTQLGTTRQDFRLDFTEPWLYNRPLRLDVGAWRTDTTSNRDWDQSATGFSVGLTRRLENWKYWRQTLSYRLSLVEISNIDNDYSAAFRNFEEDDSIVSAIIFGMERDTRNSRYFPSSGSLFGFSVEYQSEFIGSYAEIGKATASYDVYFPLFAKSAIRLSISAASVESFAGDDVRVFDRLWAGGLNSVRGFDERSLGPVDSGSGEAVGGKSRLLTGVEFIMPVYKEMVRWVVFTDAGNVWDDPVGFNPGELNVGVGTGIRLLLPIGALSLDYGFPIVSESPDAGDSGRFHFTLGYNF